MESYTYNKASSDSKTVDFIKKTSRSYYSNEIFNWQYKHPKSSICVIQKEEQILGSQGMIFTELLFEKEHINSHKSETTFLEDSLRGKGQFKPLYAHSVNEAIKSGSQLIWGFTALGDLWERTLLFKCDKQLIFESNLIVNQTSSIKGLKRIYYFLKALQNKLKRLGTPINDISYEEFDLSKELSILKAFESFFSEKSISLDYTSETIQNRLFHSPLISYRYLKLYVSGKLEGLIIYHETDNQFVISEFMYLNKDNLISIVKKVISYAMRKKQLTNIRFWGNQKNEQYNKVFESFAKFGGKITPVVDMQFVYKPNDEKIKTIDTSNYLINGLWTEGFTY